jgi:hypothetical protein
MLLPQFSSYMFLKLNLYDSLFNLHANICNLTYEFASTT